MLPVSQLDNRVSNRTEFLDWRWSDNGEQYARHAIYYYTKHLSRVTVMLFKCNTSTCLYEYEY